MSLACDVFAVVLALALRAGLSCPLATPYGV